MNFNSLKQVDVARAIGVSRITVNNWLKQGLPKNPDNTYSLPDCITWLLERAEEQAAEKSMTLGDEWLSLYRKYRAEKEKILVDKLRGSVIPVTEVEEKFANRIYALKSALLILSRRIGARLAATVDKKQSEVVQIIDEEVYGFLDFYSQPINTESGQIKPNKLKVVAEEKESALN
jgi:phage terminase Nu1 subunit (DNA packaging protein)